MFSLSHQAMVRLHRILFSWKKLPLSMFGEFRSAKFGNQFDRVALSRRAFVLFNRRESRRVPRGSTCLGWDTPKHTAQIPGCRASKIWSFQYKPGDKSEVNGQRRMVLGDLTKPESFQPGRLPAFDMIMCNQVFEHVVEPFAAARTLHRLLKPGGLVFWSAPFLERNHFRHADFFRYTVDGAKALFLRAGFEILVVAKVGDSFTTTGYLMGYGAGDVDSNYTASNVASILRDANEGDCEDPQQWNYMGVNLVARKPAQVAIKTIT